MAVYDYDRSYDNILGEQWDCYYGCGDEYDPYDPFEGSEEA